MWRAADTMYNIVVLSYNSDERIRGYFQRYALYKSTFYLLTYLLTYYETWSW